MRLSANKITMSRASRLGQKLLGRVGRIKVSNAPIEFQQDIYDYDMADGILEKDASVQTFLANPIVQGAGMAIGATLGSALMGVGAKGIDRVSNMWDQGKYDESLRTAIQMSPTLQRYGFNRLKGFMPMIIKASPTVAAEPRLLANYLESMIDAEGHLNMVTFSELANIENTVLKNEALRNDTVSRSLILDVGKGLGQQFGKNYVDYKLGNHK